MNAQAAWVKPPQEIGGLDHLAVQATAISIYGRMLPGITNVTDRVRYYSFYAWLIWALESAGFDRFNDNFIDHFRRADCLFTMIAIRHAHTSEGSEGEHSGAVVGISTLEDVVRRLLPDGHIRLTDYSNREGAVARYFKNQLGGLGQYYVGVLAELGLLQGGGAKELKYTRPIGESFARAMDASVDRNAFISAVVEDRVTADQLNDLASFCPCSLQKSTAELSLMRDLIFVHGDHAQESHLPRRRTLQLLLHLTDVVAPAGDILTERSFRNMVYSGSRQTGESLRLPAALAQNCSRWRSYARQELLSIAVQGLFFALLDANEEAGQHLHSTSEISAWFIAQQEVDAVLQTLGAQETFPAAAATHTESAPDILAWGDESHECSLANTVVDACQHRKGAETRKTIISAAVRMLLLLQGRRKPGEAPFPDLAFAPQYLVQYPIQMLSFYRLADDTWADLSLTSWLRWIVDQWGVNAHLRVALRKLRGQSKATFRIRPSEIGYRVVEAPAAAQTTPRLRQALRVLQDLGALQPTKEGVWVPSSFGREMMALTDA